MTPSQRAAAARQLVAFYERNGYVRYQDPERIDYEGWEHYKKGDEVRLVARNSSELRTMRRLLKALDFKPGRAFAHGNQHRQPIYGREAVERFLELVGKYGSV